MEIEYAHILNICILAAQVDKRSKVMYHFELSSDFDFVTMPPPQLWLCINRTGINEPDVCLYFQSLPKETEGSVQRWY